MRKEDLFNDLYNEVEKTLNKFKRFIHNEQERELCFAVVYETEENFKSEDFFRLGQTYGTLLYAVLYGEDTTKKQLLNAPFINEWVAEYVLDCNLLLLNELLHYIHLKDNTIRQDGVEVVANIRGSITESWKDFSGNFIATGYRVFLGEFPEDLERIVEDTLSSIRDDVSITYTTTWMYCHLDCGFDYSYKENEHPRVEIACATKESFACAKKLLLATGKF